jgi:hypothetical protein
MWTQAPHLEPASMILRCLKRAVIAAAETTRKVLENV